MNIHNHLDSKLQFDFLLNSLRSRDRFTPWLKAKKIKNIEYVKFFYNKVYNICTKHGLIIKDEKEFRKEIALFIYNNSNKKNVIF